MTSTPPAGPNAQQLRPLLDAALSRRSRMGHIALLIGSAAMTVVVSSLWLTEPVLPTRTAAAFAALIVIGVSWMVLSGWVLTRRRPLYGRDGVLAARMAVTFTSTFALGALALGYSTGGKAPIAAAGMGLVLVAAAVTVLVRAQRTLARLTARREALERELGS